MEVVAVGETPGRLRELTRCHFREINLACAETKRIIFTGTSRSNGKNRSRRLRRPVYKGRTILVASSALGRGQAAKSDFPACRARYGGNPA